MRLRILFFSFFTLFLFSINFAQNLWNFQQSNVNVNLRSIYFVDEEFGCVVGDYGTVLITTDGGNKWIKTEAPITDVNLLGVHFVDREYGWIVATNGFIFNTTNGGYNWNVSRPTDHWFYGVYFLDRKNGWAIGGGDPTEVIYATNDGGITWQSQIETGEYDWLFDGYFFDDSTGWVVGYYGDLFKTDNAGTNWSRKDIGINARLQDIEFSNKFNGLIAGYEGMILKTSDAGETWTEIESPLTEDYHGLTYANDSTAFMVTLNGKIVKSNDSGFTWTIEDIQSDGMLHQVYFVNDHYGWAVGEYGAIIAYKNNIVSVKSENTEQKFELIQNYPNPFNPSTKIRFNLPNNCQARLVVFNILGEIIRNYGIQNYSAGQHEINFDGSNLSSGFYLYKLDVFNNGLFDYSQTKKMLLVK